MSDEIVGLDVFLNETFNTKVHKNVPEVVALQKKLLSYSKFQNYILDLSNRFIRLDVEKLDETIVDSLDHLCKYYGYDHASIWEFNYEEETILCSYSCESTDKILSDSQWRVMHFHQVAPLFDFTNFNKPLFLKFSDYDPQDFTFSVVLKKYGIKALYLCPLINNGMNIGGVVLSTCSENEEQDDTIYTAMQLYGTLITNVLLKKKQDAAYKESTDIYKLILDSLNEGVGLYDRKGEIRFLNKKIIDATGECITTGVNVNDMITMEVDAAIHNRIFLFQQVVSSGKTMVYEDLIDDRWFSSKLYPIFKDGLVSAVTIITDDVTDRKKTEDLKREAQVLREKEHDYLEILDGSTVASWIYDYQNNNLKYSREWRKRIGGENVGDADMHNYIQSIIHPEDFIRTQEEQKTIFKNRQTRFKHEYRIKTLTGDYIWALDQGKIIYSDEGMPIKVYGTTMDIDESKKALHELEATKDALACEVEALNRAENALQQSEQHALKLVEELKRADKAKDEFLSILSHELRNPLATIVTGLSLINHTTNPEQMQPTLDILKRQTKQLTRLVDDLLDLTRINNNTFILKKERVNLNALVMNTALDLKLKFEQKNIDISASCEDDISIYIDPVRIKQSIENLLYNALSFTKPHGHVGVSVRLDNNEAVIQVADSGIGMDSRIISQIFDPFIQADASLDRPYGGLGLGLSIVKKIIELHGGSISVSSKGIGKGSEFVIRLPMTDESATVKKKSVFDFSPDRLSVLVIEDNHDFARLLQTLLAYWGHRVFLADNGFEGIEKALKLLPDVVICDIGLPRLNGYDVARAIIKDMTSKKPVLIALTGYAADNEKQTALDAGYDYHLAKPVEPESLKNLLRRPEVCQKA